jgi:hypothetical protein
MLPKLVALPQRKCYQELEMTMTGLAIKEYVDAEGEDRIVDIEPKPPSWPIFQVAATKEGSGVRLLNEPPENTPEARSCLWWRRGRVSSCLC